MGDLSPWHLLIIAAVFVLLFGAARLPDASRSLGRSLRIFKSEIRGMHDDDETAKGQPAPTPTAQVPAPLPAAPAAAPAQPAQPTASVTGASQPPTTS